MKKLVAALSLLALAACGGGQQRGTASSIEASLDGAGTVVLWCHDIQGAHCQTASRTLGVAPVRTKLVPERLLGPMVDLEDDCQDRGVAVVLDVMAGALGLDPGNWHDNVGSRVDRPDLDKTFVGGGCTNCCWDESEPPVKVHAVDAQDGRLYLVRVWEEAQ